jgi:hypothetical protein
MKKFWSLSKLLLLILLGVASIVATTPGLPPYFTIITANNEEVYTRPIDEEAVFACLNEKVKLQWSIPDASSVTLTATPLGNLNPDFEGQKAEAYGSLETTALGNVSVALEAEGIKFEAALELLSEDICTGFPINLIANFEGKLRQRLPEVATLNRDLELRWRGNTLQARLINTVTDENGYIDEISQVLTTCQLFPEEDRLLCLAGAEENPSLRLEGTVTSEGFAGSYQGFDESTGSSVSFVGTFNFVKAE